MYSSLSLLLSFNLWALKICTDHYFQRFIVQSARKKRLSSLFYQRSSILIGLNRYTTLTIYNNENKQAKCNWGEQAGLTAGLRIRIRSDPVFLHDSDPVFKFLWIRIRFQLRFWNIKYIAERSLKVIYQKKNMKKATISY